MFSLLMRYLWYVQRSSLLRNTHPDKYVTVFVFKLGVRSMSLHSESHDYLCRIRVVSAYDSGNRSEYP